MFLIAAAVAEAPEVTRPWYVDFLMDWGGWAVLAVMLLLFVKYGVPKIVGAVSVFFQSMREDHKTALTEQRDDFIKVNTQQRDDFREERGFDRGATKEATVASHNTALAMARLSDSMDNFKTSLEGLPEKIRRATERHSPTDVDQLKAVRAKETAG